MDGNGCFVGTWKYSGSLSEQPWIDICIYEIIRNKLVSLENDKREAQWSKDK